MAQDNEGEMENQNSRLLALEKIVQQLRESSAAMTAELRGVTTSVDRLLESVARLSNKKTNWQAIAAWTAIAMMGTGGYATLMLQPVRERVFGIEAEIVRVKESTRSGIEVQSAQGERLKAVERKVFGIGSVNDQKD